jgi:hypothetical protein
LARCVYSGCREDRCTLTVCATPASRLWLGMRTYQSWYLISRRPMRDGSNVRVAPFHP